VWGKEPLPVSGHLHTIQTVMLIIRKGISLIIPGSFSGNVHKEESMSETHSSDAMKNLVKFMILLAIAGMIMAFLVTFMIVQPQDATLIAPKNYCFDYCTPKGCIWSC